MPEGIIYSSQLVKHVTNYLNYGLECKQSETAKKKYGIYGHKMRSPINWEFVKCSMRGLGC